MRFCVINVGGFCYTAFSPSTCEAVADALKRFPNARRISVRSKLHWALPSFPGTANDVLCLADRHAQGEKNVHARLPAASDVAGQAAWGKGLAYCEDALH
ncbi:MAG: hypothetical protein RR311_04285 [Comamonas sp.]